ncbi:ATP-binding protein [Palleronia aestuarii]|nr:ATP-binding protein [Palleronia aestuarii]
MFAWCMVVCAVESIFPALGFIGLLRQGDVFTFLIAFSVLWLWSMHSITIRTFHFGFFCTTVIPAFAAFVFATSFLDPEFLSPSKWPLFYCIIAMLLAFVLSSGWVARRIKLEALEDRARASAAATERDRFFAMISHEIRTPLNGILGTGQMLVRDAVSDIERERAETITVSGQAMQSLLDDLLDQAKIAAGQFRIRAEPMSLEDAVHQVRGLFADSASSKGLLLDTHVAPDLPEWITGDPLRLRQIMSNLVSNAVKHTERGSVRIEARRVVEGRRERLIVTVTDTGPGISPDALEEIFLPYSQLEDGASVLGLGTGLGLAIARDLARLMDGELTASSTIGSGSVFTLVLPLVIADAPAMPAVHRKAEGRERVKTSLKGLRVLVVDDTMVNRRIVDAFLSIAGVEVTDAASGAAALEILRQRRFDLVLTDLHMPRLDGAGLLKAIRADPRLAAIPVLCLSGQRDGVPEGFDGHLTKPVDREALYAAIHETMGSRNAFRAA